MKKLEFTCKACGKTIQVQEDIYMSTYKDCQYCLSCRSAVNEILKAKHQKENN